MIMEKKKGHLLKSSILPENLEKEIPMEKRD